MESQKEIEQKEGKSNLTPLHFTMSETQYTKLKTLKLEAYCKTMYILRLSAYYIATIDKKEVKAYKDLDFKTKSGKHYKVDLPNELYAKMKEQSETCGLSMSKLLRIGLNDILNFL